MAAFHLKTGFESRFFETRAAKASWASQSKQAFGKFGAKQTGLSFPSDSPGEKFRLLGGGVSGSVPPVVGLGCRGHREGPLRQSTAPRQLVSLRAQDA